MKKTNLKLRKAVVTGVIIGIVFACAPIVYALMKEDVSSAKNRPAAYQSPFKAGVSRASGNARQTTKYAPTQLIIKLKPTVKTSLQSVVRAKGKIGIASLDNLLAKYNVQKAKQVFGSATGKVKLQSLSTSNQAEDLSRIHLLQIDAKQNVQQAVKEFSADPNVEYAQPNYIMQPYEFPDTLPNDTYVDPLQGDPPRQTGQWHSGVWGQSYSDMWGLEKIQANEAWKITQGEGIVVAVVDSGVDYNHVDLKDNIWINHGEIGIDAKGHDKSTNGVDDDGNGYIDDWRGWNFVQSVFDPTDNYGNNDPMDDLGHGTHCAGTIAAVGNNQEGIIGVAPKAKIMCVKGLGPGGGTVVDLAQALVYAAKCGAQIISNSWGCSDRLPSDPIIEGAVREAYRLGAKAIIFAAGNSNDDVFFYSPQNMKETITVASSDSRDNRSDFSNYGALIDVAAPGGNSRLDDQNTALGRNILSLRSNNNGYPTEMYGDSLAIVGARYYRARGTSMAAPHVSGVAALILNKHLAEHPGDQEFGLSQIRQILRASADDIGTIGFDRFTGYGRVNAFRAVQIDTVPKVEIRLPLPQTTINPADISCDIRGTAQGTGFTEYQLSYNNLEEPDTWIIIPVKKELREEKVSCGELGVWNISKLETGNYLLRLTVVTTGKKKFEDVVAVNVEPKFIPICTVASQQCHPRIWGDKVVWEDYRESEKGKIYLYDFSLPISQRVRRISSDESYALQPDIRENQIIWEDWRDLNSTTSYQSGQKIYSYLLPKGPESLVGPGIAPRFDVNGNIISSLIAFENLQTGEPAVFKGDISVKSEERKGNFDLYLYDTKTGAEARLTADPTYQGYPVTYCNRIVWEDERNKELFYGALYSDIYGFELNSLIILVHPKTTLWQGQENSVPITVVSPFDTPVRISAQLTDGNPLHTIGALFTDLGNGKATFSWRPTQDQEGKSYKITFTASDGSHRLSVSRPVKFKIIPPQGPHVSSSFGDPPFPEEYFLAGGGYFKVAIFASSPDGGPVDLIGELDGRRVIDSAVDKYANPRFGRSNAGRWNFFWQPAYDDIGRHEFKFTATNSAGRSTNEALIVKVVEPNSAPKITLQPSSSSDRYGNITYYAGIGKEFQLQVSAMSPLRLPLRLSARLSGNTSVTTIGAVFEDQQNGNGTFRFMPQNGQEGTYAIIFSATDNREIRTQTSVKIEVCYAPPLSLPMDGVAIMSGKLFRIGIFTPKDIGLSAQLLNNDGSFSPLSNIGASFYFVGLGFTEKLMEFGWTPTEAQAGLYKIMFQANNRAGDLTQKIMQIRVLPSQLLSPIPSQKAEVGQWYKYKLVIPFPTNSDSNYINSVRLSAEWERGKVGLEGNPYLTSGHLVHYNNEAFTPALEWEFGWQPGREDLGGYHFRFTASSSLGSTTTQIMEIELPDSTPPVTTLSPIPSAWTNHPVTITLTATDLGSGVDKTYYSIDGSKPTRVYSSPFTLSCGTYTIKYYSVDKAGNAEAIQTAPNRLKIDPFAPATTITGIPSNGLCKKLVTFALHATDGINGSGVARMYYSIDNSNFAIYKSPVTLFTPGVHRIKYYSIDNAGNKGIVHWVQVRIIL